MYWASTAVQGTSKALLCFVARGAPEGVFQPLGGMGVRLRVTPQPLRQHAMLLSRTAGARTALGIV